MLRQRLAHLAILLDDLLERLAEIVARARIISLERLSSADIAPGNGFLISDEPQPDAIYVLSAAT